MRQDDELWLKKLKEKLGDYNEPAPEGGWDRLEKELFPTRQRILPYTKWWAAVAAVLVLAISGISFYFLHTPVAEEIRLTNTPIPEYVPDVVTSTPQSGVASNRIEPAEPVKTDRVARLVPSKKEESQQKPAVFIDEGGAEVPEEDENGYNAVTVEESATVSEGEKEQTPENREPERKIVRPSSKDKLHLPVEDKRNFSSKKKWSMGLSVNSGANSLSGSGDTDNVVMGSDFLLMNDFANAGNGLTGFVDIPNKHVVFKDGVPQVVSGWNYDHQLPVTVGFSVRKGLSNGFSLETGLTYTFLKSDIYQNSSAGDKLGQQKLHYVGIPIRANWNFVDTDNFTLYVSGGGAVEKCVYGKTLTKRNTVNDLQFSLAGGVGVQYNISKQFGIYVEPGVSYFFDDGSKTETIRKEDPFNFNLQAGVRFTY